MNGSGYIRLCIKAAQMNSRHKRWMRMHFEYQDSPGTSVTGIKVFGNEAILYASFQGVCETFNMPPFTLSWFIRVRDFCIWLSVSLHPVKSYSREPHWCLILIKDWHPQARRDASDGVWGENTKSIIVRGAYIYSTQRIHADMLLLEMGGESRWSKFGGKLKPSLDSGSGNSKVLRITLN